MKNIKVGFAGMTHLGLVSAISATEKGVSVICFDPNVELINELKNKNLPISEPDLAELLHKNSSRITFSSIASSLAQCHVVYVCPDVPTDFLGSSDLKPVSELLDLVALNTQDDVVLVILSQVPPGFTRQKIDQKKNMFYQVETLIFGRAVERALFPERFIIGALNPAEDLPEPYKIFLESHQCRILKMRYESAELAKISINMFLMSSVVTSNVLAEICEKIEADWREIIPALKLDKRIGAYAYLSPGLGLSGGNLERDLATVKRIGLERKTDIRVPEAWSMNSEYRRNWPFEIFKTHVLPDIPNPRIAVLGLTYKENTHSIKNSPALHLVDSLSKYPLAVYDPGVNRFEILQKNLNFRNDILDAVRGANVLFVMTPWGEFRDIGIQKIGRAMSEGWVIDPFSIYDERDVIECGLKYVTLGKSIKNDRASA